MRRWALCVGRSSSCFLLSIAGAAFGFGIELTGCANGDQAVPDDGSGSVGDAGGAGTADDTGVPATRDAAVPTSGDATLAGSAPDASTSDDAGGVIPPTPDASKIPDAGVSDTGAVADSGAGADAADAAGAVDAGVEAGVDASGGEDATPADDAGGQDSGPSDGSPPPLSFTNPLQIDISSSLTIDTVGSSVSGGTTSPPLTAMDGSGYDFYTATVAGAHGVSGGLPSNGLVAANGTQNPVVQLHFSDASTANNSVLLNGKAPNNALSFNFAVPPGQYAQLQIYATSTEGTSPLAITLTYSDSSTSSSSVTIPDWGTSSASGAVFVLAKGLGRLGSGIFEGISTFALYGANLNPDPARSLVNVAVTWTGTGGGRLVFYGATAW